MRRLIFLVILVALCYPAAAPARSNPGSVGRIAYTNKGLQPTDNYSIRVVRGDGKADRQLVPGQNIFPSPHWSPSGRRLSYVRDDGTLVVRNVAGRRRSRVVFNPPGDAVAQGGDWSPDGRRLITQYATRSGPPQGSAGKLFVIRADGTGQRELQTDSRTAFFGWEQDGKRILITPGRGFERPAIWTYDLATGARTKVIDVRRDMESISFSPTRRWLAYSNSSGLWAVRRDGHRRRKITGRAPAKRATWLTWSPRGQAIAFIPFRGMRENDIYRVNFNGHGLRRLTHDGQALSADWGPGS